MTNAAVAELLPKSADVSLWTDEQNSLADFIGFTTKIDGQTVIAPLGVRAAFLATVEKTQLDPVQRQIYLMFIGGKWMILVSIDGLRLIAQRSKEYRGQTEPEWSDGLDHPVPMVVDGKLVTDNEGNPVMTQDLVWRKAWVSDTPPAVSRVGVFRAGVKAPTYGIATWKAYGKTNGQWKNNGPHMLSIRAEAQALRKQFPMELSNLYLREELDDENFNDGTNQRDWKAELDDAKTLDEVGVIYEDMKASGGWNKKLDAEVRARKSAIRADAEAATVVMVEESAA